MTAIYSILTRPSFCPLNCVIVRWLSRFVWRRHLRCGQPSPNKSRCRRLIKHWMLHSWLWKNLVTEAKNWRNLRGFALSYERRDTVVSSLINVKSPSGISELSGRPTVSTLQWRWMPCRLQSLHRVTSCTKPRASLTNFAHLLAFCTSHQAKTDATTSLWQKIVRCDVSAVSAVNFELWKVVPDRPPRSVSVFLRKPDRRLLGGRFYAHNRSYHPLLWHFQRIHYSLRLN